MLSYGQIVVNNDCSNLTSPTTVDLTKHVIDAHPAGTTLTWHTGTPATSSNKFMGDPTKAPALTAGKDYYAAYEDAAPGTPCYSPTSTAIRAVLISCNGIPVSNTCPTTFVDLTTHVTSSGTNMVWIKGLPLNIANQVSNPAQVGVNGDYYAVYYDAANDCFSPASAPVQVTINSCGTIPLSNVCPSNKVDLTSHASPLISIGGAPLKWFTSSTPSVGTMVADPTSVTTTGTYYPAYYDQTNNCFSPAGAGVAITITPCTVLNPDFAVVQPNTPSSGNVSTNDSNVPAGTTYGQPVPVAGNPSSCVPVMASNGSYTFTCTTPGDYNFNVPVCPPGITVNCPTVPMKVTVSNPLTPTINSPIVNPDFVSTQTGTPTIVNTLANDVSGNPATTLNPASVSVVTAPKNGTAVVESTTGDIKYTPSPGFVGSDTLKYQVCDTATPPKCGTAQQIFTVLPTNAPNTTVAVDDYVVTRKNTPVSGSVKTNDSDPQGNTQIVIAGTTNVPGAGSLVLNSEGSYAFTPVAGFVGTVAIPYTTCDNGTPQACAAATLNINIIPPVCSKPVLSVQNIVCNGTGTGYTVTFSSNAPVTASGTGVGTIVAVSGSSLTVASGNVTLTSTTSCGEATSLVVTAPICPVTPQCTQVASLSVGNAICTGNGTYSVSFTALNGTVTSSTTVGGTVAAGTISGNSVINIPVGTNAVLTLTPTSAACSGQSVTVTSPASCATPICTDGSVGISYSTVCNNDGTYNINYTTSVSNTTVTPANLTNLTGPVTLTVTKPFANCTPQTVIVTPPVCIACLTPTSVSASPATICSGASSTLTATCSTGTLTWYTDAGLTGTALTSNVVSPPVTTTYYASCVTGTCKSVASPVTVTVTNTPAAPTAVAASPSNICSGTSTTLTATCSNGTLTWYTDAGLTGTALTSNVVSPTVTTTYYAACVTGACKSVASPVTVTVTNTPAAPTAVAASPSNICSGISTTLTATCSNGTLTWYTDAGLTGTALTSNVVSPMVTTTYYAACVTGACKSVASPVTVTVTNTPIAPTAAAASPSSICSGTNTTLTATCSTGTLTWYTDASLTTISGTIVNPSSTKIYFATCKANGCESKATEVTVIVSNCISSLKIVKSQTAISGQAVGSTIVYSLVVTNTGATTLTNVTVTDANATITGTNPIASLAPAASVTLTAVHTITQSDLNMGKVLNTANVSGTTPTGGSATDVSDTGTDPTGMIILNAESVDGSDMDTDPTNDPTETILIPIAVNDLLTAPAGTTSMVNVLSNDNFLPGVNTTLIGLPGGTATGTVIFDPLTGIMSYKPAVGESGIVIQRYKVCNTTPDPDQCAEAVVTITVTDVVAKLIVKVLLQGALLPTSSSGGPIMNGIMRDDLRTASPSQIPNLEPYAGLANARFKHVGGGGETIGAGVLSASGNDAIVDWVFVELRDKNNPASVLKTRSALVQRDGDVVESTDGISPLTFTGAVGESYYVSVKHRNHLGAMTAGAVAMTATGTLVDFTTMTAAQTYNLSGYDGFEQVDVNGKMALWAGNSNADNKVKYVGVDNDQIPVFSQAVNYVTNTTQQYNFDFATPVYLGGDINMDAKVKYRGPNNDASFIFFNVITKYAGLNTGALYNYDLFIEQLP
ncbi:MAG: hypothetical protein CFE21_18265 [Bacteroidetes bacterium B1(2017)]|nr:MAG: hypothetical protein CFE21_18265 [Bacteroidetes bacterium B1(2017)]